MRNGFASGTREGPAGKGAKGQAWVMLYVGQRRRQVEGSSRRQPEAASLNPNVPGRERWLTTVTTHTPRDIAFKVACQWYVLSPG
jgi:hypothetical protein